MSQKSPRIKSEDDCDFTTPQCQEVYHYRACPDNLADDY